MTGSVAVVSRARMLADAPGDGAWTARPPCAEPVRVANPLPPPRSGAHVGALAAAFDPERGALVYALRGPRDIHASIADFVRDNTATLSRCTTPEAVAQVLVRESDERAEQRWIALAATQSSASVRAQVRAAAMRAGLPPCAIEAVIDGACSGIAQIVVDATVQRPLEQAYVGALTKRNAAIERTTNDRRALEANDRLIHDLPGSRFDLTRVDPDFTRAHIATQAVGLMRDGYPFSSAKADTLARTAILEALTSMPALDSHELTLLAVAARLARDAPPDELELLSCCR